MKYFKQMRKKLVKENMEICPVCEHDPCICETGQHIEESEQLDEISVDTQTQYFKAAERSKSAAKSSAAYKRHIGDTDGAAEQEKIAKKREAGMSRYSDRYKKRNPTPAATPVKQAEKYPLGGRDEKSGRSYSEATDMCNVCGQTPCNCTHIEEGLKQTLRRVVPGYAKREIDRKMDAGKFGKTDADKDANFQRYKKIQDKIKEEGVSEGAFSSGALKPTAEFAKKAAQVPSQGTVRGKDEKGVYTAKTVNGKEVSRVYEAEEGLPAEKVMKHRFLVTYSDPNHTMVSKRKEQQQKHVLAPTTNKKGESVYKGDAEPAVKKHMTNQGFKVHSIEHVGMVTVKK